MLHSIRGIFVILRAALPQKKGYYIMLSKYSELLEKIDAAIEASDRDLVEDTIRLVNIKSVEGDPLPGAPFGAGPRAVQDELISMGKDAGYYAKDYGCGVISIAKEDRSALKRAEIPIITGNLA